MVTATPLVDRMTVQEKLLLSQAVYKFGAVNWPVVSKVLLEHPCCAGRNELFQPQACENAYVALMTLIGINVPAQDAMKPQAKVHLRLAQTFYFARMQELKDSITTYEQRFATLMNEITNLKSGSLDVSIKAELREVLARKYGRKLLDTWVPPDADVKLALNGGEEDVVDDVATVEPEVAESVEAEPQPEAPFVLEPEIAVEEQKVISPLPGSATPAAAPEPESELEPLPEPEYENAVSPGRSSRSEELSPAPSVAPEETDPTPVDDTPATRSGKRKASRPPRGVPVTKRSARRGVASPATTMPESEAASEAGDDKEEEAEEEDVAPVSKKGKSRASTSKSKPVASSPPASARTRGSSPVASKRGASVSSTASAAPATRRGAKNRQMRDEVVAKNVREQSEAVKEEDDEEVKATRASGRRKTVESATPVVDKKRVGRQSKVTRESVGNEKEDEEGRAGRQTSPREQKTITKLIYSLLETIAEHRNGNIFQNPIKKSDAPGYYEIIKRPMDLKTIKSRIRDGHISTIDEFERDILLMFANAMMYNTPKSPIYKMTEEMLRESENHISHFRSMQHHLNR
ncbi:bromodomain-containing protein 8, partial [Tremellales sp. Uapishka_1]